MNYQSVKCVCVCACVQFIDLFLVTMTFVALSASSVYLTGGEKSKVGFIQKRSQLKVNT